MITKTFEYKGQMINYYNKVRKNKNIAFAWCGLFADLGYCVQYSYKQNNKTHTKSLIKGLTQQTNSVIIMLEREVKGYD